MVEPPTEFHVVPCTSGSASTGERVPHSTWNSVPASVFEQRAAVPHRTGNCGGTGVDWKFVLIRPASVWRKSAKPFAGLSSARSRNSSHATRKPVPARAVTV